MDLESELFYGSEGETCPSCGACLDLDENVVLDKELQIWRCRKCGRGL